MSIHINAEKKDFAKKVIMPGDPKRAEYIANTYLEDAKNVNSVRCAYAYTGIYRGEKVSVMASGMGVASAGIYYHELFSFFDVETIIRIGTAGALSPDLELGDIVLAQGACSDAGYAGLLDYPGQYCPSATYSLLRKADDLLQEAKIRHVVSNIHSSLFFYGREKYMEKLSQLGIAAIEMETEALYVEAALNKRNALSILTITDNSMKNQHMSSYQREIALNNMIEIALEV